MSFNCCHHRRLHQRIIVLRARQCLPMRSKSAYIYKNQSNAKCGLECVQSRQQRGSEAPCSPEVWAISLPQQALVAGKLQRRPLGDTAMNVAMIIGSQLEAWFGPTIMNALSRAQQHRSNEYANEHVRILRKQPSETNKHGMHMEHPNVMQHIIFQQGNTHRCFLTLASMCLKTTTFQRFLATWLRSFFHCCT